MSVCFVTAITDRYDDLHELPPQSIPVDAVCVTDDPDLASPSWSVVYEPRDAEHPNLAAKRPKMCPWRYTDADVTIWIDAAFEVRSPTFAAAMVGYADPIGQFVHPDRDCLYDEADYSATLKKYEELPLADQAASYRDQNHPERWGLWACGLIVRKRDPWVEQFGDAWLAECERWGSFQDQVSQPALLRRFDLRPVEIPGGYFNNPWIDWRGSARH